MRLLKLVKLKDSHRAVKFSRINIFTRDGYCCQYRKHKFRTEELTFDHVVPIAKGGRKTWENIVTACWRCNNRKSGRTPEEANMRLIKKPVKPAGAPRSPSPSGFATPRKAGGIISIGISSWTPILRTPSVLEAAVNKPYRS